MASYRSFYTQYDEAIRNGADQATQAGLDYIRDLFPYVIPLFIISMAIVALAGQLTLAGFIKNFGRLAVAMWLVLAGAYIPHVRDLIVDDIPNSTSRRISGNVDDRMGVVAQFELIDSASANYVAQVNQVATGITQIGNKIAAWFARGLQKIFLFLTFVVWIAMRQLAYLSCAVGAFMIIFYPFEATRQFTTAHFSKLFGIVMWQISASILLKIMLGGVQIHLKRISTVGLTLSIDEQVDQCLDIAMFFMGMFILFTMIPATVGIGAAGAASSSVASGAMISAGSNMARAGNSIQKAGANLNNAAKNLANQFKSTTK